MSNWKQKAIEMAENNPKMSWRKIARELGVSKSTVSDALRGEFKGYVRKEDSKYAKYKNHEQFTKMKPTKLRQDDNIKMLFLDIETSSMLVGVFGLFNNNHIGLNQIEEDWNILSYAAKWWGDSEEQVIYRDTFNSSELLRDDKPILAELWELLDEADFVVCHNAPFDTKSINSRFILNGFSKPSKYRIIDTYRIAKECFRFSSNKLEYLTDKLCVKYKKLKHGAFAGYELWRECLRGNPDAWESMRTYNIYDILSLEELFTVIAPYSDKMPNFDVYTDDVVINEDWEWVGYWHSNLGKYDKYRNKITGQYRRGKKNLLTKEKRDSMLTNMV